MPALCFCKCSGNAVEISPVPVRNEGGEGVRPAFADACGGCGGIFYRDYYGITVGLDSFIDHEDILRSAACHVGNDLGLVHRCVGKTEIGLVFGCREHF